MTETRHTPYHWVLLSAVAATFVVLAVAVSPPFVYFSFGGESDGLHKVVCWTGALPVFAILLPGLFRRILKSHCAERILGIAVFWVTPVWLLLAALCCAFLSFRLEVPARTNYWLTSSIGFLAGGWVLALVPWFRRQ